GQVGTTRRAGGQAQQVRWMHKPPAMAEARKLEDDRDSVDDIRRHYPGFADLLLKRQNLILPQQDVARANLNEQVMTSPGDDADAAVVDTSADYFLKLAN